MRLISVIRVLLIFIAASFLISSKTSANTFSGRLINGVGNYGNNRQYYFITSSASGQSSKIQSAMTKWVNGNETGIYTPISFRQTTNQSASVIDFHQGSFYSNNTGIIAETKFYINSNEVSTRRNWYWCKININTPVYNTISSFNQSGTVSHEIGHAFGLAHIASNPFPYSVMLQLAQGRQVDSPQIYDFNDINKKILNNKGGVYLW